MKVFNILLIILFILSAVVQYNDPDPFIWIAIYLYGALMCYFCVKQKFYPLLLLGGICVYLMYAVYLFFASEGVLDWMQQHDKESIVEEMQATKPWIEQTREFFGLLILIAALTINFFWLWNYRKKQFPPALRR